MAQTRSNSSTALSVSATTHIVQDGLSSTIYVLLPILAQSFGITYAQVGLLKGIKSLSQAVLEFSSGWFAERLGEYRLIIVGLVLSAVGYVLMSIAPGVIVVALCLLVVGAGTALHHAPSSALIANGFAEGKRSSALGLYNASGDIGKLAFTGLFSLGLGAGLGWHHVSALYGLAAAVAALSIWIATRSLKTTSTPNEKPDQPTQSAATGWGILHWRSFGALLVITSIDTVVQASVLVFIAFLMLSKGVSLTLATAATVLVLAGGVVGKAGCGYLADRIGVRAAFTLIQILTALGLVLVVVAPNGLAMAALIPLGAVVQGTSTITYGFAAGLIDARRMARGYALLYSAGTLASAIGPLSIGVVADLQGIDVAIYLIAAVTLLAIPPIYMLRMALPQPGQI